VEAIDDTGQVISEGSDPIPGMWAAVECWGGVIGDIYAGSRNCLTNCLMFGRIAVRSAARSVLGS
jgi:succinate dehydrogenase/fumarate reductase flavoprotein subunit